MAQVLELFFLQYGMGCYLWLLNNCGTASRVHYLIDGYSLRYYSVFRYYLMNLKLSHYSQYCLRRRYRLSCCRLTPQGRYHTLHCT